MTEQRKSRNGNGQGSDAVQRKDGRWASSLTVHTDAGPKRQWFYARTERAANSKLQKALRRRDAGEPIVDDQRPFGEYLYSWLAGARPSLAESSVARYEVAIRRHLAPMLGGIALARLTPEHIQRHYAQRLAAGASPRTIAAEYAVLHQALDQAVRFGLLLRNPAQYVRRPRAAHHEPAVLTPETSRALLAAARADPLEALWVLGITTAMRQGELLALRWRDVDLDGRSLVVRANRTHAGVREDTKTHRMRRIDLVAPAVAALLRHRAAQEESVWLFPSPVKPEQPLTSTGANRAFARFLAEAGLPRCTMHTLRHSCATLLMALGISPKIVSELLGHSSVGMTLDLYSHNSQTIQRAAVDAMERYLETGTG